MWIKNNSNRGWEQYNCGKEVIVDIEPKSEFEIDNASGMVLLRNLGAETWLVQIEGPKIAEISPSEPLVIQGLKVEEKEEVKEIKEKVVKVKPKKTLKEQIKKVVNATKFKKQ